ncbi:MAG: hypothetical protein RI964_3145 [Pseudomonadota bacterium]|jgi:hypothetical protein
MQNPYKTKLAALAVSFVTVAGVSACHDAVKEDAKVPAPKPDTSTPQVSVNPPPPPPVVMPKPPLNPPMPQPATPATTSK